MHKMSMGELCPCGKGKAFDQCCGRYLTGKQHAKTPEQLMRSRYSAYALGGYGEYLFNTWHPMMSRQLTTEDLSEKLYQWTKLEIINKTQKSDQSTVEFKANFVDQHGNEKVLHEISFFQRVSGKWLYVGADEESSR